jgi:hypothetical protein
MPVLRRPDDEIRCEAFGRGYPILLLARGGMRSRAVIEADHDWHTPRKTRKAA